MIQRLTLATPVDRVRRTLLCDNLPGWPSRYNIAPPQPVPTILRQPHGGRRLTQMQWGLIPEWAKDEAMGRTHINAPVDALERKPAFLVPLQERRCLVAADGWYDWQRRPGGVRRPWHFARADGQAFAIAALWSTWVGPEGRSVDTVAIVTVPANDAIAPVGTDMPAILEDDVQDDWLDPQADPVRLIERLVPCWSEDIAGTVVGPAVNDLSRDDPACMTPA